MPVHFRHFHSCPHAIVRLGGFSAEIFSPEFILIRFGKAFVRPTKHLD
ncbi:hypothetical protein C7S14_7311 [Burkholderia cepacia]|nr:hypothetical protein C7S14_7311 [Burkholderia cepacia]